MMKISEIAAKYALQPDQLRYWERMGLMPPVPRDDQGQRQYRSQDELWLRFILTFKAAQISDDFLIEYASLAQAGPQAAPARQDFLQAELDQQVQSCQRLTAMAGLMEQRLSASARPMSSH
ncbi:MerR family transcriptional regulator [Lapidilactobacillus luobeiensis]|uniref:MerR family transcriptional regulator n=1 Tax=Lapidilactobacillus luobeiensis TaxID=2950371 RepID=UPI0021C40D23|nr:MerR family transcriptional regulator [Lapidilactobacillus luobeiensis]